MRGDWGSRLSPIAWLLLSTACSTVIGIDGNYTDQIADAAGAAGTPSDGNGGAAADGGTTAQGGAGAPAGESGSSAAGSSTQGGASGCAGLAANGLCWYLGNAYDSCTDTCSNHGGPADGAASFIGTSAQGGSLDKCAALLSALGQPAPSQFARTDDKGIGCTRYGTRTYWTSAPDYNPASKLLNARLVCGCQR